MLHIKSIFEVLEMVSSVDLRTNASRLDICHNDPQEHAGKPLVGYAVDIVVGRGFDCCY
jgi:hypothetical protein